MTDTLTGRQVLALLAQDEVPEIEESDPPTRGWQPLLPAQWSVNALRNTSLMFRIKPTPPRRISVTLASGEVVSWPEPVREALEDGQEYWFVDDMGDPIVSVWDGDCICLLRLKFGNVHLTSDNAQEHADALKKINTQEVGKC